MPTVLITGGNRGLGLEFVRQYAEDGWNVIACCRTASQELQAVKNIQIETLDVGDSKSIHALADKLKNAAIDVLINNAGILSGTFVGSATQTDRGQQFGSIDAEAWERVLKINTIAPIMIIQAFTPHLAKGEQRKAINITSRMGSINEMGSDHIAYRTSKAALNAAMRTIAHNLTEQKIAVINLHPGWVKTDMGGKEARLEPPDSVTGMRKVIASITLKDTSRFISYDGTTIAW